MSSEKSEVIAVCLSERKGIQKHEVSEIELQIGLGIVSDAHAGNWHRQVSLLADESVEKMRALGWKLTPGAFAENILTRGIELKTMSVGTLIEIGNTLLCVTQIGKECHNDCIIKQTTGKCVMPTEGIFAVVVREGIIKPGDEIKVKTMS